MVFTMLNKYFKREKGVLICVFLFIFLSALLIAASGETVVSLFSGISKMAEEAKTPHLIQMHSGELNKSEVTVFAEKHADLLESFQAVKMLNVPSSNIYWGDPLEAQTGNSMDNSFVTQNEKFDFLLDLNNEVAKVAAGEIGVPVYYKETSGLTLGDTVEIKSGNTSKKFMVSVFIRDSQMNSSFITSKRFLINESDYIALESIAEPEYLIGFRLKDPDAVSRISDIYADEGMPSMGPSVDYNSFVMLNALSEGMIALIILLISMLLVAISLLCLRFAMIAAIQEDYEEIGVMKAIGMPYKNIRRLYISKYAIMGAAACLAGLVFSPVVAGILSGGVDLYFGGGGSGVLSFIVALLLTMLLFGFFILFCMSVLRALKKITPVKALTGNGRDKKKSRARLLPLSSRFGNMNFYLGFRDLAIRRKTYATLLIVFVLGVFIMLTPYNLYTTIDSPNFITYMGIGKSDIRLDIPNAQNTDEILTAVLDYAKSDDDVEKLQSLSTCRYKTTDVDGIVTGINIESGDQNIFPLSYLSGKAPEKGEIALSVSNSDEFKKNVGDHISLIGEGAEENLTVSGIYQDITNGGKTAKMESVLTEGTPLWFTINLGLKDGVSIKDKLAEYRSEFLAIKVNSPDSYKSQNLGAFMEAVFSAAILGMFLAAIVLAVITVMFAYMLIVSDGREIAAMRAVGFSLKDIERQYLARILTMLALGIIIGTIASNTLGEGLVSGLAGMMGASKVSFETNPIITYLTIPLFLFIFIGTVCAAVCRRSDSSFTVNH
ncbi:MAG TPA: hypothetical protein DEQ02_10510 [Ruminococcaceae bacterium]|nr:hypothetical protein [Oscillospiraceae bacterium]